ncbi:MAG: hypothetical protein JWM71_976, partial [Solirubrobacteraceae bacterium]|nr:hypothetical protein [Solirubrobacteraceae bacterium]
VLFGVCGLGATRFLLPGEWRPYLPLFVLPVGAACSTLALTLLGIAHVPFGVSLPVVLGAGAVLTLLSLRATGEPPAAATAPTGLVPSRVVRIFVPLALGLAIGAVGLLPTLRAGFSTVQGQNGDAILAVGTANFLRHAPPTSVRPDLALDKVPIQWHSKLPIYYGLAAVSVLAGQNEIMAFSPLAALVLAMFAMGILLLAVLGLRAPPLVGLVAAFFVALDRIVVYVSIHTYYNQLWAMMTLPFVLLCGWRFLRAPSPRSAALALLFTALALFTYPLLLPFPAVFFAVVAWTERGRARDWGRSIRLPRWAYVVAIAIAIPVVAVLVKGIVEKLVPALDALRPGGDLSGWAGGTVLPYLPFGRFLGVETAALGLEIVVVGAVLVAAVVGLRRSSRDVGLGLGILFAGAILSGVYLRLRGQGELFWFKDLSFAGPLILTAAVVGLASLAPHRVLRVAGAAGLALLAFGLFDGTRREVKVTYELGSHNVLQIADWDRRLPASQTIRIDVPPGSWQLWSWYLLPRHRVSASQPLGGFFPHPPFGLHADYALEQRPEPAPPDAVGPPVFSNPDFSLYRLRHSPGPDTSSKALVYDVKKITY